MSVTLRDVARHAGVSTRTVSNVVNDFPHVAAATRERVQAAVRELGYRPNLAARNLRRGRSGMIGVVLPELDVPYFGELTRLIIEEARRASYIVVIDQTDGDIEEERALVLAGERSQLFDGLIFSPLSLSDDDLKHRTDGAPIVLLGEHIDKVPYDHILIDNVAAARAATEHLIAVGRRRIAAIGDQPFFSGETAQYRTRGYRQAIEAAGRSYEPELVVRTDRFHRSDGAAAMTTLLAGPNPPDAVFCYNDLLAFGAMRTVLSAGLRVPEDVAIVGFDDIEEGCYTTPTLTTISPDKKQIARLAVQALVRRLDGKGARPRTRLARFSLQVRESTAGVG
jgi:DNA-binding LacI/PurR family transcriptional regulator